MSKFSFALDVFWPYRGDSSYFWNIPSTVNGCGTGSFLESLVTNRLTGTNGFTGNVDEPLAGFSFETACNSHDICYNSSSGQANCDLNFHHSLTEVCSSNYDCETFANLYGSLLRTFGREPYTVAGKTQE